MIRLHDYFPPPRFVSGFHDPASRFVVLAKVHGGRHHTPEVDFGESSVDHALQEM
jgi:hypothetical protein